MNLLHHATITDEELDAAAALWRVGTNTKEIARLLSARKRGRLIHESQIYVWLHEIKRIAAKSGP